jgi:hypothetical protein
MMRAFRELLERLGFIRAQGMRFFALEEELHDAVLQRAGIKRR